MARALVALCVIAAVLFAASSVDGRLVKSRRASLQAKSQVDASSRVALDAYMQSEAMMQLLDPVRKVAADAGVAGADLTKLMDTVAVRQARMEAAVGLAANKNQPAMQWVLVETLRRIICFAKALRPTVAFDTVIADLFALPGSTADGKAYKVAGADKTAAFIKIDEDRSGGFLSADLATALQQTFTVVEKDGNYRELLHLVSRLGQWGEGMTTDELKTYAPNSFRGLIVQAQDAVTAKNKATIDALKVCQFNFEHMEREVANLAKFPADAAKKSYIAPLPGDKAKGEGWVVQARLKNFKANPMFGGDPAPAKAARTLYTNALYQKLGMPQWSAREQQFYKDRNILTETTDSTVMPWTPGAAYTWFKPSDDNKEWLENVDAQGLVKDSGPSGTTDEILQAGDYVSITSSAYGACAMRDSAFAGMQLQLHHSLTEIAQGATSVDRATPKFIFDDPFTSLAGCPVDAEKSLTPIATPWPASYATKGLRAHRANAPTSINHLAMAMSLYAKLSGADDQLVAAVAAADFGSYTRTPQPARKDLQAVPEIKKLFRVADEPAGGAALVLKYICSNAKYAANNTLKKMLCHTANPTGKATAPKNKPATAPKSAPKTAPKTVAVKATKIAGQRRVQPKSVKQQAKKQGKK